MKMHQFTYKPNGETIKERFMVVLRNCSAVLAKRARTKERCRHCLTIGSMGRGGGWGINHGCDGCAEIENAMEDVRKVLADEREIGNAPGSDTSPTTKERPRTAKDGAYVDMEKYIKSPDELHRMTVAELCEHIMRCFNAYARLVAHKAVDSIGREG